MSREQNGAFGVSFKNARSHELAPYLGTVVLCSLLIVHYCINSAGLPVRRSILFAIGGWVENRLANVPALTPRNG